MSLEEPDQREFATSDPRRFLAQFPDGAVLDEVQRAPDLFSYLQTLLDEDRRVGRFVLTGSSQFDVVSGISQSLAGRVGLVTLLPFSLDELNQTNHPPETLEELLHMGLYPPIHDRGLDARTWLGGYVQTYVERDVRRRINVRDLSLFQRFVRMCAARTGQLLNASHLASDCGVTHNTARAWLSVLEASYLIHLLPPHHRNFNKRLVKTPKLYFYDPGLAAWLLGVQTAEQLVTHPMRGALFETWVVSELLKQRFNRARPSNLSFWRDRTGHEVDVLIDTGQRVMPVEIKSSETIAADFFSGIARWQRVAANASGQGWLVYGGDRRESRSSAEVVPWRRVGDLGAADPA